MELAQELFVTAVVAVIFSFVIAKLVSVATSGCESVDGSKVGGSGGDAVEEVRFGEEKLRSPSVGSERRVVEAVEEELRTVDRFGDEQVVVEKVVDPAVCGEDAGLESGEVVDEQSEISELPEKLLEEEDSGEAEISANEAVKCDVEETEGNDDESLREASQSCDVGVPFPVVDAAEAADVVVEEEEKEEDEEKEKEKEEEEEEEEEEEIMDDDDWEGIERSELEKDFVVAARFADDRKDRLEAALGDDAKMRLYGLHKVSTEGPCRDSPPMAMKVAARAKWYP